MSEYPTCVHNWKDMLAPCPHCETEELRDNLNAANDNIKQLERELSEVKQENERSLQHRLELEARIKELEPKRGPMHCCELEGCAVCDPLG